MIKKVSKTKNLSKEQSNVIRGEMTVAHNDYSRALLKTALYKTNDGEVSSDLVQTTFIKTLIYLRRGGKIDLMRSFLNHVLGKLIIDEYRHRARKNKVVSLDALMEKGFDLGYDDSEKQIDAHDGVGMMTMLPLLPKKYELVMRLRYIQGLSIKEMAVITKQTQNAVAVQTPRGLEKLKKIYKENSLRRGE